MPIDFEQEIIEDCLRNLAIPMAIKQEHILKDDGFKVPKNHNVCDDSFTRMEKRRIEILIIYLKRV